MKTREEFVRKWKNHLAGMALYGTVSEMREGPLVRASRALEIPAEVERLLGMMYADMVPDADDPAPTPRNGLQNANGKR